MDGQIYTRKLMAVLILGQREYLASFDACSFSNQRSRSSTSFRMLRGRASRLCLCGSSFREMSAALVPEDLYSWSLEMSPRASSPY